MSMMRIRGRFTAAPRAGVGGQRLVILLAALTLVGGSLLPASAETGDTSPGGQVTTLPRFQMPRVLPTQFSSLASDSLRIWERSAMTKAGNRGAFFTAVQGLFRMNTRFSDRVAKVYPRNQMEWIMITDRAADSLAVGLGPVLKAYTKANPEEVLTTGRIAFEQRMARIVGPPGRMLGFHVVMLADHALAQADTLLARGLVNDVAGVQDGVLRSLQDWVELYAQVHGDVIARHESHLNAEDWILVRLEDNCGNKGSNVWTIGEMYVAKVGVDSTRTPPEEQFAHEYTITSQKCPGDQRVVYFDMPLFQDVQKEIYRRTSDAEAQGGPKKPE